MRISLHDIESAIRRNFVLKEHAATLLETDEDWEAYSDQTARVVFVGIALERGFSMQEVCDYLDITSKLCLFKAKEYKELMRTGSERIKELKRKKMPLHLVLDKTGMADSLDLRMYRKSMLVNNCLSWMLQAKTFEFRQTLPDYVQ